MKNFDTTYDTTCDFNNPYSPSSATSDIILDYPTGIGNRRFRRAKRMDSFDSTSAKYTPTRSQQIKTKRRGK